MAPSLALGRRWGAEKSSRQTGSRYQLLQPGGDSEALQGWDCLGLSTDWSQALGDRGKTLSFQDLGQRHPASHHPSHSQQTQSNRSEAASGYPKGWTRAGESLSLATRQSSGPRSQTVRFIGSEMIKAPSAHSTSLCSTYLGI